MIRKLLPFILLASLAFGQGTVHTVPNTDSANVFTGTNQFTLGITAGPIVFANIGTVSTSTTLIYISDASTTSPCTGAGTGALAIRQNGAWNCSGGGGGGGAAWSALTPAIADLTLPNTTFNTTISNAAATNFIKHSNTTAATSAGVNQNSPTFNECGNYFTSGASAQDCWNAQTVITASATSATVTNVAESAGNVVTLTITGGASFVAGQSETFTGLTTATWLNNQNTLPAGLITASSTSLTFTDPTSHGVQGSAAETGKVTQNNPLSAFTVAHAGSGNSVSQTMFQSGEATFSDGTTYPTMNIGQLSVPGRICSTTGSSSYGVVFPNYGFAMHDICPTVFTAPAPPVNGTSSRSIMGMNAAIALAFNAFTNSFAINGQIATPPSYTGNIGGGQYGVYHETDYWHTGNTNLSNGGFFATYNNSNGTCSFCIGLHAEAIGNFYGGTNTPITTSAAAIEARTGVFANATHTNDYTIHVLSPITGGTFSNGHIGIQIDDQTNAGAIPYGGQYAFRIGAGNATPSGQVDLGANTLFVESTVSGGIQILAPAVALSPATQNIKWPTTQGYFSLSPCITGKVYLSADFTSANASGLQAITGLGCAIPVMSSVSLPTSFNCPIMYSQATASAGDQFGVNYSGTITNFNAWGNVATNTGAATPFTTGTALAIASNTPTSVVTFTPGSTGLYIANINGTVEAANSSGTLQLYVTNGTAANVIVVKRSSYCQFN
jgi:hypothetical protein